MQGYEYNPKDIPEAKELWASIRQYLLPHFGNICINGELENELAEHIAKVLTAQRWRRVARTLLGTDTPPVIVIPTADLNREKGR